MAEIKIEVILNEDEVKDLFEDQEIKFSKKKFNELKRIIQEDSSEIDEAVSNAVEDIIVDNFGE